jgi:predicted nucleic acid-binding protein
MRYWDTSVLLKLFVKEDDSELFAALIEEAGEVIHTSELSRLELLRALWGKRLDGVIVPGAEKALMRRFESEVEMKRIILIPIGTDVCREFDTVLRACYMRQQPIRVRTVDALHLASALASRAKEIVCTDARMREAASALQIDIHPGKSR